MLRGLRARRRTRPEAVAWAGQPRETLHAFDEPLLPVQPLGLATPPYPLRASTGVGDLAMFLGIGEAWAQLVTRFLPDAPLVLDLGCGCAKLGRFLHLNPRLRYVGIDVHSPSILWCQRAFAAAGERFRFVHFDANSATYNPEGRRRVSQYRLPVEDRSVDVAVCASLFAHLAERDAAHYLTELARVLKPKGHVLVSVHDRPAHFLRLCGAAGFESAERIGLVYGQVVHRLRRT